MSLKGSFNCSFKDKTIYQKAKGCFFIKASMGTNDIGEEVYNVYVDSLWKEKWQLPLSGTHDVGNPKVYTNMTKEEFDKMFERI